MGVATAAANDDDDDTDDVVIEKSVLALLFADSALVFADTRESFTEKLL